MMGSLGRRAERRVDYRVPVRMTRAGDTAAVLGRALNLSPGGMLVDTPVPCEVGTPVLCDLPLPGGAHTLRGRVARLHLRSPDSAALAIAFVDLSQDETAALRTLVERRTDDTRDVMVQFEGLPRPVRCRARLTDEGFQLTTTLSFLRIDSQAEIALSSDAPVVTAAVVSRVALEEIDGEGLPRLRIDLRAARRLTPAARDDAEAASDVDPVENAAVPLARDADETLAIRGDEAERPSPGRRRLPALAVMGGTVAAAAGVILALIGGPSPPRRSPAAPTPHVAPVVVAVLPPPPATPEVPVPPDDPPPPAPAAARAPAVSLSDGTATATVGLRGSVDGAVQYPLASPPGVVINLPHARAGVPLGTYRLRDQTFREIWVRPLAGGGIHLRFLFASAPAAAPRIALDRTAASVSVVAHAAGQ